MQYETIFEDGSYSIAEYENDEEALSAVTAHHERATRGEPALAEQPQGPSATRIVKLIAYENPPGDIHADMLLPEDQVKSELKDLLKASTEDGVTDLRQLAARVRDLSNPIVPSAPHESNYKAEGRELELPWSST